MKYKIPYKIQDCIWNARLNKKILEYANCMIAYKWMVVYKLQDITLILEYELKDLNFDEEEQ